MDFNVPGMRAKNTVEMLAKQVSMVNSLAPARSCGVVIFPDLAKDSSLRGLYDEEKEIQEIFFSLQQCCELRFIELQLDF